MKKLGIFLFLLTLLQVTKSFGIDQIVDSFKGGVNSIVNTVCLTTNLDKFQECPSRPTFTFSDDTKVDEDQVRKACCDYFKFLDCMERIAIKYCGPEAGQDFQSFRQTVLDKPCAKYTGTLDCINPVIIWIIAILIAIIIVLIIMTTVCWKRIKHRFV